MNTSKQNDQINEKDEQKEETREQEFSDFKGLFVFKKKFKIIFTKNGEMKIFNSDGHLIRIYNITNSCDKYLEIPFNLEQLQHFQWIGQCKNMKKVGKWTATWNNQIIQDVGGQYCQKGMKQGQWKEIFKNYSNKVQVYEIGDYINNLRTGKWSIIYQNKLIGGGLYNVKGQKYGQWIDLCDYFQKKTISHNQIIYQGEYYNGNKIGIWNTYRKRLAIFLNLNSCKKRGNSSLEIMGMEKYDQKGQKNGKCVQLSDHFEKETQIVYCGEYKNGKKCGIWDTLHQTDSNRPFYLVESGVYNDQGLKNGKWSELSENYQNGSQVIHKGQYKNGIKIGKWDSILISGQKVETIGYGCYDDHGIKNGIWLELSEQYQNKCKVIYYGEYKKGKKIGKWEIQQNSKVIGGGLYSDQGLKTGNWIDLAEYFWDDNEVIYKGVYYNGGRIGKWDILFRGLFRNDFRNIGGGSYDDQNLKNGTWIDLSSDFSSIVHKGVYDHGKKIGLWDEMRLCDDYGSVKIGQKKYD